MLSVLRTARVCGFAFLALILGACGGELSPSGTSGSAASSGTSGTMSGVSGTSGTSSSSGSTPLGPGCLGSPGETCGPYPEGTVCPGPGEECVACGAGVYTLAPSDCTCTSGRWSCGGSSGVNVSCPNPGPGTYSDPQCTVPYLGEVDASSDGAAPLCEMPFTAAACAVPHASSGPCPTTLDELPTADWCTGTSLVNQWTTPCDGLLAVAVGDGGDCSTLFYFDATSRQLVGVTAGCNSSGACRAGVAGFRVPSDCIDGSQAITVADVCSAAGDAASVDAASATTDPCNGLCAQGQQCVQSVATGQSACAGPACGNSVGASEGGTADGGACPSGESCQTVRFDPCPLPAPGQAQCNIASVTYQACVAFAGDGGSDASTE